MIQAVNQPLADRLRPKSLAEIVGQQHLVADGKPLFLMLKNKAIHSMVFWGPPGTGKTTLAKMLAKYSKAEFIALSAVLFGDTKVDTDGFCVTDMQVAVGFRRESRVDHAVPFSGADIFVDDLTNEVAVF